MRITNVCTLTLTPGFLDFAERAPRAPTPPPPACNNHADAELVDAAAAGESGAAARAEPIPICAAQHICTRFEWASLAWPGLAWAWLPSAYGPASIPPPLPLPLPLQLLAATRIA